EEISDEQAIMLSDIFPTAYFGAKLAEIKGGDAVAIFGCGPVGLFCIASAKLMGAGRIFAIDTQQSRLEMARALGAEVIDFNQEDRVEAIHRRRGKSGVARAIAGGGVAAAPPHQGPAAKKAQKNRQRFEQELHEIAPETHPDGHNWLPGEAPSQVLTW